MINYVRSTLLIIIMTGIIHSTALAQNTFGVRLGAYDDSDELFVGAELLSPLGNRTYLNPNLEYVFIDHGTYLTANVDFVYNALYNRSLLGWFGGGAGLAYFNPKGDGDSNSELALNVISGIGLRTQSDVFPYFQLKLILGEADDVVFTFGLRF